MTTGQRLLQLRTKTGIRPFMIAMSVGMKQQKLWHLENDRYKNPGIADYIKLAKYYGVSTHYIATGQQFVKRNQWFIDDMEKLDLSPKVLGSLLTFAQKIAEK